MFFFCICELYFLTYFRVESAVSVKYAFHSLVLKRLNVPYDIVCVIHSQRT